MLIRCRYHGHSEPVHRVVPFFAIVVATAIALATPPLAQAQRPPIPPLDLSDPADEAARAENRKARAEEARNKILIGLGASAIVAFVGVSALRGRALRKHRQGIDQRTADEDRAEALRHLLALRAKGETDAREFEQAKRLLHL